ncbi:hypothetical protein NDU88_010229 [Pleurodeles waltl]|uniref:Uncharacterized protein n=1 Tax=Pleurodeles waltl TaxID=8319 RepID=A0AAV7RXJ7_PLEWA|nr:hypothetical protein NDU88_010229 [Pleurodeles waltl]
MRHDASVRMQHCRLCMRLQLVHFPLRLPGASCLKHDSTPTGAGSAAISQEGNTRHCTARLSRLQCCPRPALGSGKLIEAPTEFHRAPRILATHPLLTAMITVKRCLPHDRSAEGSQMLKRVNRKIMSHSLDGERPFMTPER